MYRRNLPLIFSALSSVNFLMPFAELAQSVANRNGQETLDVSSQGRVFERTDTQEYSNNVQMSGHLKRQYSKFQVTQSLALPSM